MKAELAIPLADNAPNCRTGQALILAGSSDSRVAGKFPPRIKKSSTEAGRMVHNSGSYSPKS
jgi:hypothetical protein